MLDRYYCYLNFFKMQILLLENIKKLGSFGQQINVKDGYARNFLFKKNKAIRATIDNLKYFTQQQEELKGDYLKKKAEAIQDSYILNGRFLSYITQASEDGKLYGSVSKIKIFKILKNFKLKTNHIDLDMQFKIKKIGIYEVKILLHPEIKSMIKLVVARSDAEVKYFLEKK